MTSKVYFSDMGGLSHRSLIDKLGIHLKRLGLGKKIKEGETVAIKLHFGERGSTAFVHPIFLHKVVEEVKNLGGLPFLTDTNTLYVGCRYDSVSHLNIAAQHGFSQSNVGAPVIIADGLKGLESTSVRISGKLFQEVNIAPAIVQSNGLIGVAHFKGHDLFGFGGCLKNIGMGCASRQGKFQMHSTIKPQVDKELCQGCKTCLKWCRYEALRVIEKKATIEAVKCVGCGYCLGVCPSGAVQVEWDATTSYAQQALVEYVLGVLQGKEDKSIFLNFLTNITPQCDCCSYSDTPIVSDVGVLSSTDPVAIDQASVDLVKQQEGRRDSSLKRNFEPGRDKFRGLYPEVDWQIQLDYGEKLGLGRRSYELIKVG